MTSPPLMKDNKEKVLGSNGGTPTVRTRNAAWCTVAKKLWEKGGWQQRNVDDVKKKWTDLVQTVKKKIDKRFKSGEGAVNWTSIDELVQHILGRDNPKLVAIPGGFHSSSFKTTTEEEGDDNDDHEEEVKEDEDRVSEQESMVMAEDSKRKTTSQKRPKKRLGTTSDLREELQNQLSEEHEWKRREHEQRMKLLKLKEEYYLQKSSSFPHKTPAPPSPYYQDI